LKPYRPARENPLLPGAFLRGVRMSPRRLRRNDSANQFSMRQDEAFALRDGLPEDEIEDQDREAGNRLFLKSVRGCAEFRAGDRPRADQISCSWRHGDSTLRAEQPNPGLFPAAAGGLNTKIDPRSE